MQTCHSDGVRLHRRPQRLIGGALPFRTISFRFLCGVSGRGREARGLGGVLFPQQGENKNCKARNEGGAGARVQSPG